MPARRRACATQKKDCLTKPKEVQNDEAIPGQIAFFSARRTLSAVKDFS
jgi:hypothetical protein